MNKVLFIYYHFSPLLGDWRGLGFVKFLSEFGWQPIVISAAETVNYPKDYSSADSVPKDAEVHRVGHREIPLKWQWYYNYARGKLKVSYDFPDDYKTWYKPALREARDILKKERVDLIYTSCSPFTSAFVGMGLKKEFDIPWVSEFRDPWSENDFLNRHFERTLLKPLRSLLKYRIRKGEKDIAESADKNVVVAWQHRQRLCRLYGIEEGKVEVVTNGYDEPDFVNLKPHVIYPDKSSITFLGSFYPELLDIILKFWQVLDEVSNNAEVIFIGRGAASLENVNKANLTRILHVPKEKALGFALGSDFLFLLTPPSVKWIPMKIFEYLRLGKPILALVPEDGDAARIIREAKAGYVLSHEPGQMKEQLRDIFEQWRQGKFRDFHPDWEYVAQFERRKLTEKLANIFNEVAGKSALA
jgi:glycosyltransferase involved in cell wall biosynthesis